MVDYKNIREYFSLLGPYAAAGNGGVGYREQVSLFIGVILGSLSKVVYDALTRGGAVDWKQAVIAVIASFVIFPQLYYSGGLNKRKLSFAHWTFAFQNGFFWSVALGSLMAKFAQR